MPLNTELWHQPSSGFDIEYAARFDESASSWMNLTFSDDGTGDAKIWTLSTWIKMISSPADKLRSLVIAKAPDDDATSKSRETSVSVSTVPFLLRAAVTILLAV